MRQAVVYSYYTSNITITGGGTIDGQGAGWWACVLPDGSPNTDGYDIDCCVNVLLENSYYSGGKPQPFS
jgi:hypothetical protein